jgi:hypothetical protein
MPSAVFEFPARKVMRPPFAEFSSLADMERRKARGGRDIAAEDTRWLWRELGIEHLRRQAEGRSAPPTSRIRRHSCLVLRH